MAIVKTGFSEAPRLADLVFGAVEAFDRYAATVQPPPAGYYKTDITLTDVEESQSYKLRFDFSEDNRRLRDVLARRGAPAWVFE